MEQILFEFAYFLLSQQLLSFFTAQAAKTTSDDQQTDQKEWFIFEGFILSSYDFSTDNETGGFKETHCIFLSLVFLNT